MILAWDDPFDLIIHPDGNYELACIDIENMGQVDIAPYGELDLAIESNKNKVKNFMYFIKKSAKQLIETRDGMSEAAGV